MTVQRTVARGVLSFPLMILCWAALMAWAQQKPRQGMVMAANPDRLEQDVAKLSREVKQLCVQLKKATPAIKAKWKQKPNEEALGDASR